MALGRNTFIVGLTGSCILFVNLFLHASADTLSSSTNQSRKNTSSKTLPANNRLTHSALKCSSAELPSGTHSATHSRFRVSSVDSYLRNGNNSQVLMNSPLKMEVVNDFDNSMFNDSSIAEDIDSITREGYTAESLAQSMGHTATLKLFQKKRAEYSSGKKNLELPKFSTQSTESSAAISEVFSEANSPDAMQALLFEAISLGNTALVNQALRNGASLAILDPSGNTPLHCAAAYGNTQIIRLFLDKGAAIDAESVAKCTPLHIASFGGFLDCVELLLKQGAKKDQPNSDGITPEKAAELGGYPDIAEFIRSYHILFQ